ncbi:AAA family ATPase [Halobacterium jilantaiense]|uniref:CobQ/CobB/MinD/ParA nucleotide binding domain-containing protein n=1 Tax=Halobacterium jilantaiense TaxID=355548 RepID=A0A1I0PXS6_9EURY|nr:AAA family ATPase [Halobacterium jilantaiense]SEW19284.1 CobQ/CobB/MinD/ParA nucleotide binding domain-containing protein [Halobacterium jilantaiense]
METTTAALVGVAGGAGATRLATETAAVLARDGASVGVFDAAFATQGLSQHVAGRIDPDATAVLAGDTNPSASRHDLASDAAGDLAVYPAFAPFTRLAEAKTTGAARRFETVLDDLAAEHDYVLVDTPPVAANQAVAAVTASDAVAAVVPPGDRGVDSLQRVRGRLADVGADCDLVVANRHSETPPDADLAVPAHDETGIPDAPVALDGTGAFTEAVAALAESLFDESIGVDFDDDSVLDAAREKLA